MNEEQTSKIAAKNSLLVKDHYQLIIIHMLCRLFIVKCSLIKPFIQNLRKLYFF
jgi:hypothetical protein